VSYDEQAYDDVERNIASLRAIEAEVSAQAHKPLGPATVDDQKIYDSMAANYAAQAGQEPVADWQEPATTTRLEDLLSKYWDLAYEEGHDYDACNWAEANKVLHEIRELFKYATPVACPKCAGGKQLLRDQMALTNERTEECVKLQAKLKEHSTEIARLKTVPMKYRRMAFNAQLQDENK